MWEFAPLVFFCPFEVRFWILFWKKNVKQSLKMHRGMWQIYAHGFLRQFFLPFLISILSYKLKEVKNSYVLYYRYIVWELQELFISVQLDTLLWWGLDMERRSQTSYNTLCNGIVSHGAPVGVFGSLPTKRDTNARKWARPWSACTCIFVNVHAWSWVHAHASLCTIAHARIHLCAHMCTCVWLFMCVTFVLRLQ